MLGLSTYRLGERRSSPGTYDFSDPEGGRILGSAGPPEAPPEGWSFWAILGFGARDPARRPRLVARRAGGEVVFTLRQASGLLYDSRRVYDAAGGLIAQFRSGPKTSVRGGFGIIDLRGLPDDGRDIGDRPWLGRVDHSDGLYRLCLAGNRDAGRIVPRECSPDHDRPGPLAGTSADHFEIEAATGLREDPTGQVLLLAAALALAWNPPPG
jgi:hypothetical protein